MTGCKSLIDLSKISGRIAYICKNFADNSQRKIAQSIGVAPSLVSRWVNDKDFPSAENIKKLCSVYSLRHEWLYDGTGSVKVEQSYRPPGDNQEATFSPYNYGRLEGRLERAEEEVNWYRNRIKNVLDIVESSIEKASGERGHKGISLKTAREPITV